MEELERLGSRLRRIRQDRGWTLADLADRSGMSVSTLSRLESGKRRPSLELLVPLTRLLGVRVDDLLDPPVRDPRVRRAPIRRDGLVILPLSPEGSPVRTYKITYPPRPTPSPARVHDGYEWLYVLTGRLALRLGEQEVVLAPGEAAEFDTRIPHSMTAVGDRPAEVLSIFNEAGARIHTLSAARGGGSD